MAGEVARGGWGRHGPVCLGAHGTPAALAEVVVQLAVGQDQEEPLPDRHRSAAPVAIEMRRLQLLELFFHGPHRGEYGPRDGECQGWGKRLGGEEGYGWCGEGRTPSLTRGPRQTGLLPCPIPYSEPPPGCGQDGC